MTHRSFDQTEEIQPLADATAVGVVPSKDPKKEKLRIWKNVILASISFMITFMAYASLQDIQSSLNTVDGLGVASISIIYACAIITGLFFTPLIVSKAGCKKSLVIFTFCYAGFAAVNFHPTWYTMVPVSVIAGVAAGPLWTAKCSLLTSSAVQYSTVTGKDKGPIITHFFGIFSVLFLLGYIAGMFLMSLILKPVDARVLQATYLNQTLSSLCGAMDCPSGASSRKNVGSVRPPSRESVFILLSIFLGAIFLAGLLVAIFIDDVKPETDGSKKKTKTIKSNLLSTIKIVYKDKRMTFLIPLMIFTGLQPGFVGVDFAKSYVTCSLGIENVGFVLMSYAGCQAALSGVIGILERLFGRMMIMLVTFIINLGLLIFLLIWEQDRYPSYVLYIVAGAIGAVKGVWRIETNSYPGVLFVKTQETAFSVVRVCTSVGYLLAFAWGYYLCVYVKIYILIAVLTLSIVCYFITEYIEKKRIRNEKIDEKEGIEIAEVEA